MSLFPKGEKWWYEFTISGKRFRSSCHTTDKAVAELVESEHRRSLERGEGKMSPTLDAIKVQNQTLPALSFDISHELPTNRTPMSPTGAMTLEEAGKLWLTQKAWKRRKPKTVECSRGYLRSLIGFFGNAPLSEFHAGSLRAYQTARAKSVGPSAINHELNALSQILRQAKCWGGIADYYSPLKEPEWQKPKTFTLEEQQAIFASASEDPGLELAELVFTITRHTSASGSELRLSRIRNLDLEATPPTFRVTGDTTKNTVRPRLIPLDPIAEKAFRRVLDRANRLGAHFPEHFLFPFRVNQALWDPTRPASRGWLRKQSAALRERTGIKHLRPHLWRHQLCTEMLERGESPETVRGIMGWVSQRMIETYSHTRLAAKMAAFGMLEKISPTPGQATPSPAAVSLDLMDPAILAEIDRRVERQVERRVAQALHQEREERYYASKVKEEPTKGARVIRFPGAG